MSISVTVPMLTNTITTSMTWLQETSTEQVQENLGEQLKEHAQEISQTLGKSETVNEISSGILEPIYQIAEVMSIPSFYWVAFALMVAGVVSFAFQLVLGKFFLLFKGSLNLTEIFSDLLGLVISLTGLVLTTQAATQNSTFPENSVAGVSAAIAGAFFGLVFYWWGQKQEFRAVAGKRAEVKD